MATDVSKLLTKKNNVDGDEGVLRAEEFVDLVRAVVENQQAIKSSVKGVVYNNNECYPDGTGMITIYDMEADYLVSVPKNGGWIINPNDLPTTVAKGKEYAAKFKIEHKRLSTDSIQRTAVTFSFYRNGTLVGKQEVYDHRLEDNNVLKEVSFDFAPYLDDGKNSLEIRYDNGLPRGAKDTLAVFEVTVINLALTINFDNNKVYTPTNTPTFTVTPIGNKASLFVNIDGDNNEINGLPMNAGALYDFPQADNDIFRNFNRHGIHELTIWAEATDYPGVKTAEAKYNYIFGVQSSEEPLIISTVKDNSVYDEYGNIILTYIAYYGVAANGQEVDMKISLKDYSNPDSPKDVVSPIEDKIKFDNGSAKGTANMALFHIDEQAGRLGGNYVLEISVAGNEPHKTNVIINQAATALIPVDNHVLYFSPKNKTNTQADGVEGKYNEWFSNSNVAGVGKVDCTFSDNFEFSEGGSGWNTVDGVKCLQIKKRRWVEINYKPFETNPCRLPENGTNEGTNKGMTISFEFATRNCIKEDTDVISCWDEESKRGFKIKANSLIFANSANSMTCNFKEDTRIRIDLVIQAKNYEYSYNTVVGKDATDDDWQNSTAIENLMIVYVDGVYQGLRLLEGNVNFKQTNPQKIRIGSEYADIDLYNVRLYNTDLNCVQIITNYAFDTPVASEKSALYQRNNIFADIINDTRPDIVLSRLQAARPELPLFFISLADDVTRLPDNKSDWKYMKHTAWENYKYDNEGNLVKVEDYNDPHGAPSFTVDKAQMRNQGTSSMNYPWPWRNWDWKTKKNDFSIAGTETGTAEKWPQYFEMPGGISKITLKKDYASSEQANNAICSELFDDMAKGAAKADPKWNGCLSNAQQLTGNGDSDYRLALLSVPCFMFQDKSPNFDRSDLFAMGMMNLIPNKNEVKYLGFDKKINFIWDNDKQDPDGDNPTAYRAQSWECSENHVNWDTKYIMYYATKDKSVPGYDGRTEDEGGPIQGDSGYGYYGMVKYDALLAKNGNSFTHDETLAQTDENGEPINIYVKAYDTDGKTVLETTQDKAEALKKDGKPIKHTLMVYSYLGNFINAIAGNYEARYPKDTSGIVEDESVTDGDHPGYSQAIWGGSFNIEGKFEATEADFGYTPDVLTINEEQWRLLYNETKDICEFHNWLVDCNRCNATGLPLSEDILGLDWVQKEKFTNDTPEYRLAKFKNECTERMLIDQWVLYYIWREQFWMFDSGSKNLQLYTMDGTKWGCMVRDADTALGINNVGKLMFPPYLEDKDYYIETAEGTQFVFNGAANMYSGTELGPVSGNQVLNGQFGSVWLNIRDAFPDKVMSLYQTLSGSASANFDYKRTIKKFEDHQAKWCEALYNFGMRQYFGGGAFTQNILSGVGDKKNHRRYWLEQAFYYRQSKYKAWKDSKGTSSAFSIRATHYDSNDTRDLNFVFKTYMPMYLGIGGTDQTVATIPNKYHQRVYRQNENKEYYHTYTLDDGSATPILAANTSDKNIYIWGKEMITDLGDMARVCKWTHSADIDLPKLTSLRLGDHTGKYTEIYTYFTENGEKLEQGQEPTRYEFIPVGKVEGTLDGEFTKHSGEIRRLQNNSLASLVCTGVPLLSYLDVTNHKNLQTLGISTNLLLTELYAEGTDKLTQVTLPESSALKTVKLGKSLTNLSISKLTGIEEFTLEGAANLESISITDSAEVIGNNALEWIREAIRSKKLRSVNITTKVNWTGVTKEDVEAFLAMGSNFKVYGTINLNFEISAELKIEMMAAWNQGEYTIDDELNQPHVTYISKALTSVSLPNKTYITNTGYYVLKFTANPLNGNNFLSYEFKIDDAAINYGYIEDFNPKKGTFIVKKIDNELDITDPKDLPIFKISVDVKTKQGNNIVTKSATGDMCFYQRLAKPGDIVYNDGSFTPVEDFDSTLEPIGVCFYVEPLTSEEMNAGKEPLRLMMALNNISVSGSNLCWGIKNYADATNDNAIPGIELKSNTSLNPYNIVNVKNINNSYDLIPDNNNNGKIEFKDLRYGQVLDKDGWAIINGIISAAGQIGYMEVNDGNAFDNYFTGDKVPYGKYYTDAIIYTRDVVLNDLELPKINKNSVTEFSDITASIITAVNSGKPYAKNFAQAYYPAASYCNAYAPTLSNTNIVLADKFKKGNWWLPSYGEFIRIAYYQNMYLDTGKTINTTYLMTGAGEDDSTTEMYPEYKDSPLNIFYKIMNSTAKTTGKLNFNTPDGTFWVSLENGTDNQSTADSAWVINPQSSVSAERKLVGVEDGDVLPEGYETTPVNWTTLYQQCCRTGDFTPLGEYIREDLKPGSPGYNEYNYFGFTPYYNGIGYMSEASGTWRPYKLRYIEETSLNPYAVDKAQNSSVRPICKF